MEQQRELRHKLEMAELEMSLALRHREDLAEQRDTSLRQLHEWHSSGLIGDADVDVDGGADAGSIR